MLKGLSTAKAAILLALTSVTCAHATEQSFEDRVRTYLLENPEVILEALAVLTEREEAAVRKAQIAEYPDLFDRAPLLGLGDPTAPIRAIEFFDYKCLPCKAVHAPLEAMVAENPQLRIEMRQLPILTPASEKATRFAFAALEVAGEDAYRKAHTLLWEHRGPFNTVVFTRMSDELDLAYTVLETAMWSEPVTKRIDQNRDVAIALNLIGTPAFVTTHDVAVGTTDVDALTELFLSQ